MNGWSKGNSHELKTGSFSKRDFEEIKNRHNRTPAVFNCVGLLINGSAGRWSDYPLFSHPRIFIFCWELFIKAPESHIVCCRTREARRSLKYQAAAHATLYVVV